MSTAGPDSVMNYVIRMVVPMRREFGLTLDVSQFLRDKAYAEQILAQAAGSQDPRLQQYVKQVRLSLHSPPLQTPPAPAPARDGAIEGNLPSGFPASQLPSGFSHSQLYGEDGHKLSAEELRDKVKKKYTGGLR